MKLKSGLNFKGIHVYIGELLIRSMIEALNGGRKYCLLIYNTQ